MAGLYQLRPVLLEVGRDTPQPYYGLQLPCCQSAIIEGALQQSLFGSLTLSITTADSHAAR